MKKSLYFTLAAASLMGFAACDDGDYDNWASPMSSEQQAVADAVDFNVTGVTDTIKYVSVESDSVQVVNFSSLSGYAATFELQFSDGVILPIDSQGRVGSADLKAEVISLFGKAPSPRTVAASVVAYVTVDGASAKLTKQVEFPVILDAPALESHYYYLGSDATDKTYELKNASGQSFYDDPELSVIVPVSTDAWHWFRIAGESSYDEAGSISWDLEGANNSSICPEVGDCEDRSGSCINGTKSWHLVQQDGETKYKITVNVIDMTIKIEGLSDLLEYYLVGRQNGWNLTDKTAALYPVSKTAVSYTSYFTAAWDCRIATPEQVTTQNWSNYGSSEENGTCTSLIENTGHCIMSPEAGYYTLTVDFATMTYSWSPVSVSATYESMGLIGVDDDWSADIAMTQVVGSSDLGENTTHNWYAKDVVVTKDCGVKFRANGGWDVNWGAVPSETSGCYFGTGVQNGDNISITAGTYNVYLNDITGQFFFIAQ